ncbi:5'-nucleotidase, lipoprotein e(P4) family [Mycoplasma sp. 1654_15]|uniref:5'-nucleotidase, lipoprotein e(P4) family n=1 Tax=Mycoplasma sp. 1654_15 TaxID=2725994 RepID=UPI0014498370|nr:5'-nucleotidase, lipoprotein e(P4) family [Mycoplasma sp. 1654_15]QJB71394.1 5'-nucleotidase, lipoprotein e(P4) family [Mycoplasma sp. 1654_15]
MNKFKYLTLGILSTVVSTSVLVSCGQTNKINDNQTKTVNDYNSPESVVYNQRWLANVWNSVSAEKDAMTLNLYNSAKKQFDAMIKQEVFDTNKITVENDKIKINNPEAGKAIPVVFMDIDETILNNFAFQNYLVLNNKMFNPQIWNQFVQDAQAKEIKGAFDFIRYVWSKGGVVMFNSNREQENQKTPTLNNLVNEGLDKKYLPDFVWWMQGVDLTKTDPWNHIKKENNKRVKSEKEERMNFINEHTQGFDLSSYSQSGNAVVFKTVMRIGDNYNDFNDIAIGTKLNKDRNKLLQDNGKLFGNFDIKVKGIKYKKQADKTVVKVDETWSESYVLIGGNASYGGFESALDNNYYSLDKPKQTKALKEALQTLSWNPKVNES